MPDDPDRLLIKPSDVNSWSLCARRVWLDNKGDFDHQTIDDPFEQLVIELGLAHEQAVLERLSGDMEVHTASSPDDTARLMADRVPAIYQAQLLNEAEGMIGLPDFLLLDDSGQYQAADAKLSLSEEKKEILVQLGIYRRLLGAGLPAIVFLGDGEQALIGDEANSVANQFATEMRELLHPKTNRWFGTATANATPAPTTRITSLHSNKRKNCRCFMVYRGVQGCTASGLESAGIETISKLASADANSIPDVPYLRMPTQGFEPSGRYPWSSASRMRALSTGAERSAETGVSCSEACHCRTSRWSISATCMSRNHGRIWFFR